MPNPIANLPSVCIKYGTHQFEMHVLIFECMGMYMCNPVGWLSDDLKLRNGSKFY